MGVESKNLDPAKNMIELQENDHRILFFSRAAIIFSFNGRCKED
jgi:hypothetical protein